MTRAKTSASKKIEAVDRYDREFRERIETISDADFWSAISANARTRPALSAARAGDRAAAWRLLGRYHGDSLATAADQLHERTISAHESPAKRQDTADRAAAIRERRFPIWHATIETFEHVIDFNRRLTSSNQFGFHYLGWLRPLLDQSILERSSEDRDDLLEIIRQYYDQRTSIESTISFWQPVFYELGCGAKTSILLDTYSYYCDSEDLETIHREAILKLLLGFARHLYRDQESGPRPGNQQVTGCVALHWIGSAFREFREAPAWRRRADRMLRHHAEQDFFGDGGHSERSWDYGWIALHGLQHVYERSRLYGVGSEDSNDFWQSFFRRGYAWYGHALGPHGHNLNYNDGTTRQNTLIAKSFRRVCPDAPDLPGHLLGVDRRRSSWLPESGFAFMRDPADPDDGPYMSVNFGPHGGTHTHPGLLDFTIWNHGVPVIEEVGRFGDYSHPLNRLFRSDEAHNQIVIDGLPMNRDTRGQDMHWYSDETVDMISGWHEAYPGHRVYRQIVYMKPHFWLIHDLVVATGIMGIVKSYLHARAPFQILDPARARVDAEDGALIQFIDSPTRHRMEASVDYEESQAIPTPEAARILERYPFCESRFRLAATRWLDPGAAGPVSLTSVIVPTTGGTVPTVLATPLHLRGSGQACGWELRVAGASPCTIIANPLGETLSAGPTDRLSRIAVKRGRRWTCIDD